MRPEPADNYPLAPLQRGLLFHALASPGSTLYVEQLQCRLDGPLDVSAFRAAWQAVCRHHPALRTGFDWQPDDPRQRVTPAVEVPLAVADWRDRPAAEQAAQLPGLAAQQRQTFDLARPPLFRLQLVRCADEVWQLLWTYHHLILDDGSVGVMLHDLATAYACARHNQAAELSAAPPFADVVAWVNNQDLAAAEQHWAKELAGFTEPTPLGVLRDTAADPAAHQHRSRRVAAELAAGLRRYADTHGIALDTLLAGGFAVVLARYSGVDDVVFGLTTPGRDGPLPGLDRAVGPLMNTVPARVRLGWDQPPLGWLAALDQQLARSRAYAYASLDRVQAASEVPAGRRLFDALLSVEHEAAVDQLGDVQVIRLGTCQQTSYPVTVRAHVGKHLELAVSFDGDQLDPVLAERMLEHVERALAGLVAGGRLCDVALLSADERSKLAGWGAARASFPAEPARLLPARFAACAERQPDREAVSCGDQRLSYRQLADRVGRLAHRLRQLGVAPGVLVGVCLPRGVDLVTAVLAVACASGGYLPLDRRDPPARLRSILADASAAVLVTDRDLAAGLDLPENGPAPVLLDDPAEQRRLAALPTQLPPRQAQPSDVAYVIYTSGSTGAPKGVVVEHAQLARLFDATRQWFPFGPDDVWTLFHSIAFDFSVWELWGALGHGGRLVVVPGELTRDPARFRELLLAEGVTVLNQTPASFRTLQHADLQESSSPSPYRLRWVIFGGEKLEVTSVRPWLERYGDQRPQLVNMYGITETTVHVTYRPIARADLVARVPSPIGQPIPDLAVRLVDPHDRLVPVGVPGEMQVGGAGVARGYLHRPDLTAARFADRPDDQPRRWYRTGDLARWLPDGELEFLGRIDDQVKIRGHRVELGEIESVLTGHPQVREAAVVAHPTGVDGHHQLAAYLVPAQAPGPEWTQLRQWLSERMPEHLVPAHAVVLDRLPLTSNGKLDRAALPAPARRDPGEQVAPRSDVERALAEVWADVLGVPEIGVTDNFFLLGGDSILTIQVAARARQRGVAVTPGQVFAHQTIAELATVATPVTASDAAEQGEVTGEVTATPMQVWFHQLALPHPGRWHLPVLLLARPGLQSDQLAAALDALVAHHDLLRLRVTCRADGVRQHIAPVAEHGAVPVREVDLTDADPGRLDERVAVLASEFLDGVDLATGPLLRAAVFRTPAHEPDRLLLVAHHLVVDHVSWQILREDLETACRQLAQETAVRLPAKTTDFAWWARRVTDYARSTGVAEQAEWWLARIPDRLPALPVDGEPQAPDLEQDTEVVSATLDTDTTGALLAAANQAYRTRTEELLLAAFAVAMAGWTGTPRVLVDVEGHGRDLPINDVDISRTVGWFTTIASTWLDLTGIDLADPPQVIKTVKEQLRVAPPGAAFGLARWLRDDDLAGRLARLPAAQVSFNYLGQIDRVDSAAVPEAWFAVARQPVAGARHPANPRPYRLDAVGVVSHGTLQVQLAFSRRRHRRTTMQRLADDYLAAIRSLVDHCRSPDARGVTVSDFPLAQVTARQLDDLVERHGIPEDLYPLAPLQRGLLFHTLANPHSGVYFEQFSIRLTGRLDVEAYLAAWAALQERHAVLRAGVAWHGLAQPHLVVRGQVALPLAQEDWQHFSEAQQQALLQDLLTRDRVRGFDLAEAPLTRLYLIQLGPERWQVVWSHHHLLLDRWSVALLIQEIFDTYDAIRTGRHSPAPPPRPFRDYLAYLAERDLSAAPAYWRRALDGITEPTPLGGDRPAVRAGRRDADYARTGRALSRAQSDAVREFARTHRMTLDTILHGAWALVLANRSGRDDVLFGVTTSGRPAELAGVEEMVGLFINTLPARVRVRRDQPVGDWLADLVRDQVQVREFEHTPLEQIRSFCAVPPDRPLFESGRALVNFPWDESRSRAGNLTIDGIRTFEQASHALTFVAVPQDALQLQLWYDAGRFAHPTAEHLLRITETLVLALVDDPERTVGEVLARLPAPPASDAPLPELVGYWAGQAPERAAVVAGDGRLTYRQLHQRAGQLAGWLRQHGVARGTRVATAHPTTVDHVVGVLAVLTAGAVWVPLPPTGAERLGHTVTLVPPGGVGTSAGVIALPELSDEQPAPQPGEETAWPADPAVVLWWRDPHRPDRAPDDVVCAGTISHGELSRQARRHEIAVSDVVGSATGQVADGDVIAWLIWAALGNGACLALPAGPVAGSGSLATTVLTASPSELAQLLDRDLASLAGVRLVLLRGDLAAQYHRLLRTAAPSVQVEPALDLAALRVAHRLGELPAVAEAAVTPTRDGRLLAAHLRPDPGAVDRGDAGELVRGHLARWHGPDGSPGDGAATSGRLTEWVRTLRPASMLEVGCGDGELLHTLPPGCQSYVGTDLAGERLARLRDHLSREAGVEVTLLERDPHDLSGVAPDSVDLVVIPLASHLPTAGYLARVLDAAVTVARPGGAVLLGGLRHHGLRQASVLAAELSRAADLLPVNHLRQRVDRALANDPELQVDPVYLRELATERPAVGAVAVVPLVPPPDPCDSPLDPYRYDAVFHLGAPPPVPEPEWHDWHRDVLSPAEIGWLLDHARRDALAVTGVPHPRVAADVEATRLLARPDCPDTVGELRLTANKGPAGMDPAALRQLAADRGWSVAVSWTASRNDGSLDVLFWRGGRSMLAGHYHLSTIAEAGVAGATANSPGRVMLAEQVARQAADRLRHALPDYADLTSVRVVDELPRAADGRVDEQALVASDPSDAGPAAAVNGGPVPPRTADELRLARIWEQVLNVPDVDVRTSFFDLGGDSLLAVRVIDETARAFGREVPLAVLLQRPTIEGVAAALRAGTVPWSPLVELAGGEGTPLFCVHPAGGNVLCYGDLARLLHPQPFCALQARGVEGDDPPFDDLPAMAARYLQDVRARQATGPYLLGGWSLGGLVAYEMARQLTDAGEQVGLVVMMDTPVPELVGELPDDAAILARLLEGRVAIDLDRLRALPAAERLGYVLAEAERAQAVPPGLDPGRAQRLFAVYATHLAAVQRYRPGPFAGPVRLLRAAQTDLADPDYGWGRLVTGDLQTVEVPGNHETVLWPPNVQRLAEVLREQFAAALGTTG